MEQYGSVLAPRIGAKARKKTNILNASLDAPTGTEEHRLAVKRGHYGAAIPDVRGIFSVYK